MKTRNLLLSLCLPALMNVGCSIDAGRDGSESTERGPLGKADNVGSCEADDGQNFCGGASSGSCFCDDACVTFGDCCEDKVDVCGGTEPQRQLCFDDGQCGAGEFCDDSECLSGCPDGGICPAVCFGECTPIPPEPALCLNDADCGFFQLCDLTECLNDCPDGMACPAVCLGQCVDPPPPAFCGDDSDCADDEFCADACVASCPVCEDCNNVCMPKPQGPTLCGDDSDCGAGEVCDPTACVPSCPACEDCNAACVPAEQPKLCLTDDECDGSACNHDECLSAPCPEGFACPAVCFGQCE